MFSAPIDLGILASTSVIQPGRGETSEERISRLANAYVESEEVPGIMVGIWKPSGFTLISHGLSDIPTGAPMTPGNTQRIGSITKSFTVTRLLQLADEGRLSLDDPISKYVAGLGNGNATLRQLANMTSGIFNYTSDQPFILEFVSDLTKRWTDAQLVAAANSHPPYFAPGKAWYYSNTNTVLLGMVIARVTGNSLRAEITRHVIEPLGLTQTFYPTGVSLSRPFTHGYATLDTDQGRIDVTATSPTGSSGSGAMISTLGDMRLWGRALARGALLSRRRQLARLQMVNSAAGVGPSYDRYGLGLGRINGWLGHTADLLGYQSLVMHNLVGNETVVIFVNASNREHIPTDLFRAITPLLGRAVPAGPPSLQVTRERPRTTRAASITVRGRAASEAGILLVQSTANGGTRLAQGTGIWRSRIALQPGRNVITIRSVDRLGRRSAATRITIVRN